MNFVQFKFHVPEMHVADEISDYLFTQNAISVVVTDAKDDPIFATTENPHPLWDDMYIIATFYADNFDKDNISSELRKLTGQPLQEDISIFADQDWQKKWEKNTKAIQINEKLLIHPSHLPIPSNFTGKTILLDPGLAFGTGHHATTNMCLEWLTNHPLDNYTVIDYGCGSGILAIASILFNAHIAYAIDNDPSALKSTNYNAKKNLIPKGKIKTYSSETILDVQSDLIMANIYLNVLVDLKSIFLKLLKPNGILVLTGLLLEQKDEILHEYSDLDVISQSEQDGWFLLVCRNGK